MTRALPFRKELVVLTLPFIVCFTAFLDAVSDVFFWEEEFPAAEFNPVIYIPGDGGAQVLAKLDKPEVVHYICTKHTDDYFYLWLNLELLVPYVIDCWVDNMKLLYDNVTRKTSNSPGVDIKYPFFGNTTAVDWLDSSQLAASAYFNDVTTTLIGLGYEQGVSLRGAPYDFRKAANELSDYYGNLTKLVEETVALNDGGKVILLTHSMGGLIALYFLNQKPQEWKDQHIKSLVTLACPWAGAVKALKAFAVGDDLGAYFLRESVLKQEQKTSPSLAWLLPTENLWDNKTIVVTEKRNYTARDYEAFFNDLHYINGWEMRKDTRTLTQDLTHPGVDIFCLHGVNVDTVEQLSYKKGAFPDGEPSLISGQGDGTVNLMSLEMCTKWKNEINSKNVFYQAFDKVDHMGILHDKNVLDFVVKIIKPLKKERKAAGGRRRVLKLRAVKRTELRPFSARLVDTDREAL